MPQARKGRSVPTAATWPPRAHRVLDRAHPTFSVAPAQYRYLLGRRLPLTPAFPSAARPLTARDPMRCAYHCLRPRKIGTRASGRLSLSRFPMPVVASTVAGNPDATATTDIVVAAALASRPHRRPRRPPRT